MLAELIVLFLLGLQSGSQPPSEGRLKAATENPDQVVCRQSEPVLGSRVARRRICKTRAEWRAFEADRAQLRRDLQNAGACGNSPVCTSD